MLEALLVNVIPACVDPTLVGENVTLSGTLWPAARVNGKVNPDRLKPVPLVFTADTVALVGPPFERETTSVSLCPVTTLPKSKVDGVHVNC